MRVAVLDLGSNTFHLVWTQIGRGGSITKLGSYKHVVRLGADVPPGGVIAEEPWRRAMDAVADLATRCPADCRRMAVATSVFRDAANGQSFVDAVRARFAIPVEVLSGEQEAELAWLGVASARPKGGPTAVVDIGGGSIQFAVGEGTSCRYRATLPLGVLRLVSVPQFRDLVRREAAAVCRSVAAFGPAELVFASGTARLAARLDLEDGTPSITREMTKPLAKIDLEELAEALARLDRYALIALGVPAGRADTIGLGASVMATIMELAGFSTATVAEQGLREGVIVRALRDESARSACSPVLAAQSF